MAACLALSASADYSGKGYYRLQNYKTERWASMIDDKGSIDAVGTTADLQAIKLQKNFDEVCSDPASIICIYAVGSQYNIEAQGTGVHQMIGRYLNVTKAGSNKGQRLYYATGKQDGVEKYIGDGQFMPWDVTYAVTSAKGDYRKWYIHPMDNDGDNFFGVKPALEVNGKYYTPLFGDFPFTPSSEGVKTYVVTKVNKTMCAAVLEEVKGTVEKSVPVVMECSTPNPSTNRLTIGGEGAKPSGNMLKGVYFCATTVKTHYNFLRFDPATMRVLGICSDGSLGYVTPSDLEYIPANSSYLPVEPGTPAELRCMTLEEYEAGVDDVVVDADTDFDVYDITGRLVVRDFDVERIGELPAGVYIAGGKKFVVR